jgi:transcriptional regulator with XRE-family HTH domain
MDKISDEKAEFSKRLREAIESAGHSLRPVDVERAFNSRYYGSSVTMQAVRRWLRGEAIPSQEKLQVLADWLKVEPHVLRYGAPAINAVKTKQKQWETAINFEEREAFEAFLSLPSDKKKIIREVILAFKKAYPVT